MKLSKATFTTFLASATTAVTLLATSARAQTDLVLSSWLPPRHPLVADAIKP